MQEREQEPGKYDLVDEKVADKARSEPVEKVGAMYRSRDGHSWYEEQKDGSWRKVPANLARMLSEQAAREGLQKAASSLVVVQPPGPLSRVPNQSPERLKKAQERRARRLERRRR